MNNPLLSSFNTLHQSIPFSIIEPNHFLPAFEQAFAQGRQEIAAIIASPEQPTFENTVVALEQTGKQLSLVSSILFNLNHAHTSEAIQEAARTVSPMLTQYSNDIWMNKKLFERVLQVYESRHQLSLRVDEQKLLEDTYKAFVRCGARLTGKDAEKYRAVTEELATLTLRFGENVLTETNDYQLHLNNEIELAGLPNDLVAAAAQRAKEENKTGWIFTLQYPSYVPFMKYASNRQLREQMFKAYSSRANRGNQHDNNELVKRIAALRIEKANLLGYHTYADYILEERMAGSREKVNHFLDELLEAALPFAKQDMADVAELAKADGIEELQRWDFAYYSEKLQTARYDVNDEMTRPYFRLEKVEAGIFQLANQLFGLTFKLNATIEGYHPDVKVFEVFDEKGEFLSLLYTDYFPRKTKQGGAWMTSFRDQHIHDGVDVRPHISIVTNFAPPTGDTPSLLTFNEVKTFLHEFGHALHGMLSKVVFESQSGTSVYRDFVELPSQILENWALEKEWLCQVAIHHQTGEVITDELIEKLVAADLFQSGYATVRQLSFGFNDMAWHSLDKPFEGNVAAFEASAMAATELFPPVKDSCMSTAFSHIFDGGYAAGYYGYKWAEVLDADAFESFKEHGVMNKEIAKAFRQTILERGGSDHPMKLYVDFKGAEPSITPLLRRSGLLPVNK